MSQRSRLLPAVARVRRRALLAALAAATGCAAPNAAPSAALLDLPLGDRERRQRHSLVVLDGITDTATDEVIGPAELAARLDDVRMVFVGESHTHAAAHEVQRRLIGALADRGRQVLVGLEMLPKSADPALASWVAGSMSEPELLRAIRWYRAWGYSFHLYRDIFLLARERGISLHGVNVPREIVTAVRKKGVAGLSPTEAKYLPRSIDTTGPGAAEHRRLFRAHFAPGDPTHARMSEAQWEGMFLAQCTWDAGMAFNAAKALLNHGDKNAIVVVLIGSGHVAYGLGAERQAALWFRGKTSSVIPVPVAADARAPMKTVRASYARFVWGVPPEDALDVYPTFGVALDERPPGPPTVSEVVPGSAAALAGVRPGDRLRALDGTAVRSRDDVPLVLLGKRWGDEIQVEIERGAERLQRVGHLRRTLEPPAKGP
jgi:uncharacterized iron-regulated protein